MMSRRVRSALVVGCATLVTGLTACGSDSAPAANQDSRPAPVTVFAAASLTTAFPRIAELEPELDVRFSFDGSATLVDQLAAGAPADLLATADETTMDKATAGGLVLADPMIFATNELTLIVPKDNPGKITGVNQSLDGKKLVVCAPEVPCGRATQRLVKKLGVTLTPVSEESKVTDVRGKVESGEADAGIVYTTDAAAVSGRVRAFSIPGAENVLNNYPAAVVAASDHQPTARQFLRLLTSPGAQRILQDAGFGAP